MNDSVPPASKRIPWLARERLARHDALLCIVLWLFLAAVVLTSGILFGSFLTSLGILGLLTSPSPSLKALDWASLALIALIALRVPVMYGCVGQGTQVIIGVTITCPPDMPAMLNLIRFDANRYIIPLMPFAVLGLRGLLGQITHLFGRQP